VKEFRVDMDSLGSRNSHGGQLSKAGVDKGEADSGDKIVPKHAGSTAVGQNDAEGPGERELV
jgi:hypothetical protein